MNPLLFQPIQCYDYVQAHRKANLRPKGIDIEEKNAECGLQEMFEHTLYRVFDIPSNKDLPAQIRHFCKLNGGKLTITMYVGVGPDGSGGKWRHLLF